jgi:hypothetical protein
MSPPTVAIIALTTLQIGLIRLGHPAGSRMLSRPVAIRALSIANRFAMPVFLFHMSAFLLAQAVGWLAMAVAAGIAAAVAAGTVAVKREIARRRRLTETPGGTPC